MVNTLEDGGQRLIHQHMFGGKVDYMKYVTMYTPILCMHMYVCVSKFYMYGYVYLGIDDYFMNTYVHLCMVLWVNSCNNLLQPFHTPVHFTLDNSTSNK